MKDVVRKQVEGRNQKERNAGLMESLGLRSIRERDRERERKYTEDYMQKCSNSMYMCVFNEHLLYKS